jgi:hypothetical protein
MSSVCEYNISTKFFRHGTFTSFFTVCKRKTEATYKAVDGGLLGCDDM